MFGSIALDVFIGMVLIYLLYSLLVSIIGEMLATWMGIRARLLRKAIEKMLNDNPERPFRKPGFWRSIGYFFTWLFRNLGHFFLYEFNSFGNSLAGRFYNHPSIKFLALSSKTRPSFKNGKPAYISKENFSDTLVQMLRNKGNGKNDVERINFCLKYNTLQIEPETLAHVRNLMDDSADDLNKFREKLTKWFDDTMDRTNGWYKRKLSLITFWLGFLLAVTFNVDSIKIAIQLSQDKEARNQLVQMGISQAKEGSVADRNVKDIKDTTKTKSDSLLRKSYDEVYKATESANKILGLGWKFENLRKNKSYDRTFYPHTFEYVKKEILNPLQKLNTLRKQFSIAAISSGKTRQNKYYQEKVKGVDTLIDSYLGRLNFILKTKFTVYDSVEISADTINKTTIASFYGKKQYGPLNKVAYIVKKCMPWHWSFWGFVITALMLSLGAPFWFDLLKKLVALRGAGIKPEEKADGQKKPDDPNRPGSGAAAGVPATGKSYDPEDDIEVALRIYKDIIESENGVLKVLKGYLKKEKDITPVVQINVESDAAAATISAKYCKLRIEDNIYIPTNILVTGKPKLLADNSPKGILGKGIGNKKTIKDKVGTISCLVRDVIDDHKNYIMTCYHVVNADKKWDGNPSEKEIVAPDETLISPDFKGYLNPRMDTALIPIPGEQVNKYKSIFGARYPKGVKEVSESDVYSTRVFINGYNTKEISPTITHIDGKETFVYGKERITFENLIVISNIDEKGNLSSDIKVGDSGAIVVDIDNNALGIVFAGDLVQAYALKLQPILKELGLKLIL